MPTAGDGGCRSYPSSTESTGLTRQNSRYPATIRLDEYPDGSIAGIAYRPRGRSDGTKETWWQRLSQSERDQDNDRRSRRNSIVKMRRKIRSHDLRRLLTFTNGGSGVGWTNGRDALRDVLSWLRRNPEIFGETAIVLVAERGEKNGRWHVHGAIRSGYWLPYKEIIRSWSDHLTGLGYVSPTGTHRFGFGDEFGKHKDGFHSARSCAGYMAGYVTKGLNDPSWLKGQHRYESVGAYIPDPKVFTGLNLADIPQILFDTFGCTMTGSKAKMRRFDLPDGSPGGYWFEVDP